MNSVGFDTFLKSAPLPAKSSGTVPAQGSTSEFGGYLREATATTPKTASEQAPDTPQPSEKPTVAAQQDQGSNNSSEKQAAEVVDLGDPVVEEPAEEIDQDEVTITALAAAISEQEPAPGLMLPDSEPAAADQPTAEASSSTVATDQQEQEIITFDVGDEVTTTSAPDESAEPVDAKPAVTMSPSNAKPVASAEIVATVPHDSTEPTEQPTAGRKNSAVNDAADVALVTPGAAKEIPDSNVKIDPLIDLTIKPNSDTSAPTLTSQAPQGPPLNSSDQGPSPSGAGLARDEPGGQMPMVDRARFVQRVTNAFRSAQQNDGHIQLRLSPPELGSLRIEIAVRNGVLSANLETETADARRLVLDNLPALRQRLAEQDIRIEKFDVDVRREGNQSDGQADAQDRQAQQQSQRTAAHNRMRSSQPAEIRVTAAHGPQLASSNSGLDVRI